MGNKSRSRSNSSRNVSTVTNTRNINLQGLSGTTILNENGNVSVSTSYTDHGAVQAGMQLGRESLQFGRESLELGHDAVDAAVDISASFIEANKEVNRQVLGLSGNAISGAESLAEKALELADNLTTDDTATATNNLIKYGALTVVAVVAGQLLINAVK